MSIHRIFLFLMVLSLLAACTGQMVQATPTPQPTFTPVATLTATTVPSATPEPTATPELTTVAKATAEPTATEKAPNIKLQESNGDQNITLYKVGLGEKFKVDFDKGRLKYIEYLSADLAGIGNKKFWEAFIGKKNPTFIDLMHKFGYKVVSNPKHGYDFIPIPGKEINTEVPGVVNGIAYQTYGNRRYPGYPDWTEDPAFTGKDKKGNYDPNAKIDFGRILILAYDATTWENNPDLRTFENNYPPAAAAPAAERGVLDGRAASVTSPSVSCQVLGLKLYTDTNGHRYMVLVLGGHEFIPDALSNVSHIKVINLNEDDAPQVVTQFWNTVIKFLKLKKVIEYCWDPTTDPKNECHGSAPLTDESIFIPK